MQRKESRMLPVGRYADQPGRRTILRTLTSKIIVNDQRLCQAGGPLICKGFSLNDQSLQRTPFEAQYRHFIGHAPLRRYPFALAC